LKKENTDDSPKPTKSIFDGIKQPSTVMPEHVLCVARKKPIHVEQGAGMTKKGMYHSQYPCFFDLMKQ
jgi:hypothetical protein